MKNPASLHENVGNRPEGHNVANKSDLSITSVCPAQTELERLEKLGKNKH